MSNHNYISIYQGGNFNQRIISTKEGFISHNEDVIVSITSEKIVIKKPTIDYGGKTYKPKVSNSGWLSFCVGSADLPLAKKLEPDEEESDEDQAVYYFI